MAKTKGFRQYDFTKQGQYHKAKQVLAGQEPKSTKGAALASALAIKKRLDTGRFFCANFQEGRIENVNAAI